MDGSCVAYSSNAPNSWVPNFTQNPRLNNNNHSLPGSVGNLMNGRIVRSVTGSITNFDLYGVDGSARHYEVQKYRIQGTNDTQWFDRERPYLQSWTDSRGNQYKFTFGTSTNSADYGQLRRIESNNGNYIGFYYDAFGHVVEAFTGDGRRLRYDYDEQGDLVKVERPDGSSIVYEYHHDFTVTNHASVTQTNYYSTHLLTREVKPDGRVLKNEYDEQRRVTNQWSTVGSDLSLVRNAQFYYSNKFELSWLTNETKLTNTISGYTLVVDVNGSTNLYTYTNGLISTNIDALGRKGLVEFWTATQLQEHTREV